MAYLVKRSLFRKWKLKKKQQLLFLLLETDICMNEYKCLGQSLIWEIQEKSKDL